MSRTPAPSPCVESIDHELYRQRREELIAAVELFKQARVDEGDEDAARLPSDLMADAALMLGFAQEFGRTEGQLDALLETVARPQDEAEEDTTQPSTPVEIGSDQTIGGGSET